jgi:hypothetical protein
MHFAFSGLFSKNTHVSRPAALLVAGPLFGRRTYQALYDPRPETFFAPLRTDRGFGPLLSLEAKPDASAARKGAFFMFYAKNLPVFERVLRITVGLVLIILGMLYFQGISGNLWGLICAGTGAGAVATGFLGFCPACAMVGRKLDERARET